MLTAGPIVVMQVPEKLHQREAAQFAEELTPLLESDRPRVVLDCSQVRSIDSVGIEILLHSLEEALKRDGDVKLAALSPESQVILELMRIARVFETFDTCDDAVRSFNAIPIDSVPQASPWYSALVGDLGALKQAS
ncbi:MAG TPA: STAS domain-containing protein [Candidatus Acidoferrales bacterium]|nr:STAS domain-containing protein [Candidatus Acidoferrales bacterium]